MRESVLREKSKKYAIAIIKMYQYLSNKKKEYILSKQVLRSGTSIGANISEAYYAQSDKDFIHKLSISLKEAAETEYWLDLLVNTDYINDKQYKIMHEPCLELIKMLTSSIMTAKGKLKKSKME